MNKDKAQLSAQDRKKYLGLVRDLPNPEDASAADIAFVCTEIDDGIMAWSKDEEDEKGIKMTDYARKAIGKLGGSLRTYSMAARAMCVVVGSVHRMRRNMGNRRSPRLPSARVSILR